MTLGILFGLLAAILLSQLVALWPRKKPDYFDHTTKRIGVRCSKCGAVQVEGDTYAECLCTDCIQSI